MDPDRPGQITGAESQPVRKDPAAPKALDGWTPPALTVPGGLVCPSGSAPAGVVLVKGAVPATGGEWWCETPTGVRQGPWAVWLAAVHPAKPVRA